MRTIRYSKICMDVASTRIIKACEAEKKSGEHDKGLSKEIALQVKTLETLGKFQISSGLITHAKHMHKGNYINIQTIDITPDIPDSIQSQIAKATKKALKILGKVSIK